MTVVARLRAFLAARTRGQRIIGGVVGVVLLVVVVAGVWTFLFFQRDNPQTYADVVEHFKYGSVGSEAEGLPYWIWFVLPDVFPDLLPDGPGEGYERFGFIYEAGQDRPIGTSYRERPFPMQGLNCAVCHTGQVRTAPGEDAVVIFGMPAVQLDFLAYNRFLLDVAEDERFTADVLLPAIEEVTDLNWIERQVYRRLLIPRTRDGILERGEDFDFLNDRPDWGPGRVDTFSPYKVHFEFDMTQDDAIGTAALPPLWNQGMRDGMFLHWDGNNPSLTERNLSAALGAGATEDSLDHPAIQRVATWIRDLPPPDFPVPVDDLDPTLLEAGRDLYLTHCASCHAFDGDRVGQVEPLEAIDTDPERLRSFSPELADEMNTFGRGEPWEFSNFRATDGYANMPLDGVWLRAPYLHNGSVPTLRDLLSPPEERPTTFCTGGDVYDLDGLGWVSDPADCPFEFDTTLPGNGNGGHVYGTTLTDEEIEALIEYLKTQ